MLGRCCGGPAPARRIPLLGLCTWLTVSRGGTLAVGIGVVVFALLVADRLAAVAVIAVTAAGSGLLILAVDQRNAVRDGLRTALAAHQGNEMIAIGAAVTLGVALLVAGGRTRRAARSPAARPHLLSPSGHDSRSRRPRTCDRRIQRRGWLRLRVARVDAIQDSPEGPTSLSQANALQRLQDVTGNGRYQFWQAAVREADANPLTGTGAGTFKFWWAQHGTLSGGYVTDAHSLYIQALGELGWPGLILVVAFVALVLAAGVARSIRTAEPERRLALAAATAAATAFAFAAAFEWIWLIPVLPLSFFVLAGVIGTPAVGLDGFVRDLPPAAEPRRRRRPLLALRPPILLRLAAVGLCLGAALVIALPMAATEAVRDSQALARSGNMGASLIRARDAVALQPYAASPWLQEALVLEVLGRIPQALQAAQHAVRNGPTDYDNWLVLSRLQARDGHAHRALTDYVRARSLSPNSPLF